MRMIPQSIDNEMNMFLSCSRFCSGVCSGFLNVYVEQHELRSITYANEQKRVIKISKNNHVEKLAPVALANHMTDAKKKLHNVLNPIQERVHVRANMKRNHNIT